MSKQFNDEYDLVLDQLENDMSDADKVTTPRQVKGGTFAPSDMPVIKRALQVYLIDCQRVVESERDPHPDVAKIASLLHRLGRIG